MIADHGLAVIGFATLRWLRPLGRIARAGEPVSERLDDQGDGRGARSRASEASPAASKASGDTVANSGR